jgi:pilus assembly protein CpaE
VTAAAYQFVFVDCGSRLDEATLTTADLADRVMLVTTADVPGVRNAWRRLQLLRALGLGTDHVVVVVNGYDPRAGGVSPEEVARHLGRPVDVVIPADRTVARAVDAGKLVRDLDARAPAALAIAGAIGVATGAGPAPAAPERKNPLGWIFGRGS